MTKTDPQERPGLDLRKWSFASCGAEPIRVQTMDRFIHTFEPFGFHRQAFAPAYGLAEFTLAATITPHGSTPTSLDLHPQAMESGSIVPAPANTHGTRQIVCCGNPIHGADVRIIDEKTRSHCPPDRIGEIWLAGSSMAGGYWQQPQETLETFNAFTADTGEGPFLKTGDLGFMKDGNLYVTGRSKELIIIRGNNYFPQDIERTVQESHPAFLQGATAAFSVPNGSGEQLVVVQEVRQHKSITDFEALTSAIRQAVSLEYDLPVYAALLVKSGDVPKTTSGKIQRQPCREAFLAGQIASIHASIKQPMTAESTEYGFTPATLINASSADRHLLIKNFVSSRLAQSLSIGLDSIKSHQNLNELGIDSLLSAQLTCNIEKAVGVGLPPSTFLQDLTIEELVGRLLEALSRQSPSLLPETSGEGLYANEYPLSPNQKAQWFLSQLDPHSSAANVAVALLIRGPLDRSALHRALTRLVQQHQILRTVYEVQSGIPYQRILPTVEVPLAFTSIRDVSWEEAKKEITAISQKPFNLSQPPVFRAHIFEKGSTHHLLLLNTHHIAADGWSMHVLFHDFVQFYMEESGSHEHTKSEGSADYISFSQWQAQFLEGTEGQRLWEFWKNRLAGELPKLNLNRRPVQPLLKTPQTGTETVTLDPTLTGRLQTLAKNEGVTLYVILLAALNVLLHRYTGNEDLLVCTPMSGRVRSGYLKTVGNFSNTVCLREHLGGNPIFRNLLRQVSRTVTAGIDHQLFPFSLLVERLRSQRESSQPSFRNILFVLQNFKLFDDLDDPMSGSQNTLPSSQDLKIEPFVIPQPTGQFDLTLEIAENGSALTAHFEYNCELFDSDFIKRLAGHFQILLDGISLFPEKQIWKFPLFQTQEEQRVFVEWNVRHPKPEDTACIHKLIENQADLSPDSIALVSGDTQITYEQLNTRANQIAHFLRSSGIRADIPVAICIGRSIEMIVAILAVLKADGAYVPLDPNSPLTRQGEILQDLQPTIILTTRKLINSLPEQNSTLLVLDEIQEEITRQPVTNLPSMAGLQNLAYVIYTSGSTGKPKGVQIEHRSLAAFASSFRQECGLQQSDRILQFSSLAFDASVEEIFPFLISGGTVVLPQEITLESPDRFLAICHRLNITVLDLPTAYWHEIALYVEQDSRLIYPSLRLMIIGGEEASSRAVRAWRKNVPPPTRLINTYGPTEATVSTTTCDLTYAESDKEDTPFHVPIGRSLAHGQTYLLDKYLQPVPIGIPGELYLGGQSLARGYHLRGSETARLFIPNPFGPDKGSRLFRTGDVCRYRPDGVLEYLGRTDYQVKIRGFRVELREIEAVMERHHGVYEALVILNPHSQKGPRLIGYFIPIRQPVVSAKELRTFLKTRLPDYMIPETFLAMDSWPHTSSGKIDRSRLPEIEDSSLDWEEHYVAPRCPMEQAIADLYSEILGVTRVSIQDHFFELGGHSLLAVQLVSRLRELFTCDIPLRLFFEHPTVAELSEAIQSVLDTGSDKENIAPILPVPKDKPLPLSSSQERIYFLHKLAPLSAAYNIPVAIRLRGQLNQQALQESLNQLIRKHESLRTFFREESGRVTQIISSSSSVNLNNIDLRHWPLEQRLGKAREQAEMSARLPFDLETAPLMRATLLHVGEDDYVLVITIHHIVSDQWSFAILGKELGQYYNTLCQGKPVHDKPLPLQYADFACWQRQWLTGQKLEKQYAYWVHQLSDLPVLELPTDHPRLEEQTFSGTYISLDLTKPLLNKLQKISAEEHATLYMLCLAAFKVLLHRYSGQTDIVIGSPVANRHWPSVEDIVGTFVNTLVLRTDLSGDPTFRELLQRIRHVALEGYANQDLPFEKLVQDLAPSRIQNRMPLVQVLFNFGNAPFERVKFKGVSLSPFEIDRKASQFDLSISVDTMFSGKVFLEFNTDLFDYDHMAIMLDHYRELLKSIVTSPDLPISSLNMLTHMEKQQILVEWNITDSPFPKNMTTLDFVETQATRFP